MHARAHGLQAQIAGSSLHAAQSTAAGTNQHNPPADRYGSLTATHTRRNLPEHSSARTRTCAINRSRNTHSSQCVCVTDCALFHTLIICGAFMTRTRTLAGTVMRPRRCCRANRFPTGAPRCVSAASPGIITGWRGRASVAPSQNAELLAERRARAGGEEESPIIGAPRGTDR